MSYDNKVELLCVGVIGSEARDVLLAHGASIHQISDLPSLYLVYLPTGSQVSRCYNNEQRILTLPGKDGGAVSYLRFWHAPNITAATLQVMEER